jgi:hypothetical protein
MQSGERGGLSMSTSTLPFVFERLGGAEKNGPLHGGHQVGRRACRGAERRMIRRSLGHIPGGGQHMGTRVAWTSSGREGDKTRAL